MAFLQPCFIRKNTPKLRKNLEYFGYEPFGSVKHEWDTGCGLSTDNRLGEFESFDNNSLENIIKCGSSDYEDSIDCGTNEVLFLSLAALRDDTDANQWFICDKEYITNNIVEAKVGEWIYIFEDDLEKLPGLNFYDYFHKATMEEIVEHFNK